jgi:poly-gamma-glutamate capsule biosynthesis protein CapA/YwtB (metallophosphatase superfamily)
MTTQRVSTQSRAARRGLLRRANGPAAPKRPAILGAKGPAAPKRPAIIGAKGPAAPKRPAILGAKAGHSLRIASIGLTDAALRAGRYAATRPTNKSNAAIAANVETSNGLVS